MVDRRIKAMKKMIALTAVLSLGLSVGFQPRKEIPQAQTQGISGREIKKATHQGMQFSFDGVNGVRSEGMKEGAFVYDFGNTEEDVTVNMDQNWTTSIYVARYDSDPGWPRYSSLPSISDKAVYERGWYRFTQLGWWLYYAVLHTGTVVGGKVQIRDITAPEVSLNGKVGSSLGSSTNKGVTVSWTDRRGISHISYEPTHTSPDRNIYNGKTVTEEGTYSFYVHDFTGHRTYVFFTIDKTSPSATLTGVVNGGTTSGDVTIKYNDTNGSGVVNVIYRSDEGIVTDSYGINTSRKTFTSEGSHFFQIIDGAGNIGSASFTIDKTSPEIKVRNVSSGNEYSYFGANDGTEFHTKETVEINIEDRIYGSVGNAVYRSYGLKENSVNGVPQIFISDIFGVSNKLVKKKIELNREGSYAIESTDLAGNKTKVKIVIDKTAPTIGGTLQ